MLLHFHFFSFPSVISHFFHIIYQQNDSQTIQMQQLLEKIDDYEAQLEDYKSELEKVNKVRAVCIGNHVISSSILNK